MYYFLERRYNEKALIVPLWNWNEEMGGRTGTIGRFNCTFMELKYTRTTAQKAALRL